MRVFLIGGVTEKQDTSKFFSDIEILTKYATKLGAELVKCGHDIIICSPFNDSVDYYVAIGAIETINKQSNPKAKLEFHYPDSSNVVEKLKILADRSTTTPIYRYPCKPPVNNSSKESWQYSWLFAQLNAMDSSAGVITIGGKSIGSIQLLFSLARTRNKPVLPLTFLGGAAFQYYNDNYWDLFDVLGDRVKSLTDTTHIESIPDLLDSLLAGKPHREEARFFLSYPRARPQEADYIEALLRRRNYSVFRDEEDFEPAAETQEEIIQHVNKSNVFIAIWCKEYACSPWCFDELEIALQRLQDKKSELWLLCVDETRIVPRKARTLNYYKVSNREEIEGIILKLLRRLHEK